MAGQLEHALGPPAVQVVQATSQRVQAMFAVGVLWLAGYVPRGQTAHGTQVPTSK